MQARTADAPSTVAEARAALTTGRRDLHGAPSPLVGVSSGASIAAAVVVGCGGGGAINTRSLSSVVVAWQGASSP